MLKRARASPGMRLTTALPMSIEVNSRFDGPKLLRALVERLGHQGAHQGHKAAHRIVGAFRIGDVALFAADHECAVERTPAADLDGVTDGGGIARLAQHTMVEFLAALGRPLQELDGTVPADALLVAGDEEGDRAFGVPPRVARWSSAAAMVTGDPAFMSTAPRPNSVSPRTLSLTTSAANGGWLQLASSPGGTTSVWPAKTILPAHGCRAGIRGCRSAPIRVPRR